jgi:hypothetical protein
MAEAVLVSVSEGPQTPEGCRPYWVATKVICPPLVRTTASSTTGGLGRGKAANDTRWLNPSDLAEGNVAGLTFVEYQVVINDARNVGKRPKPTWIRYANDLSGRRIR